MIVLAILVDLILVSVAVIIHYEMLRLLTIKIPLLTVKHRLRVLSGIFGAICAHIVEILLFATGYYLCSQVPGLGYLQGNFDGSWVDYAHFSFTTYTTLGYGDIEPFGHIRLLAGLESLAGLVLITWTASFLFLEMQKFWKQLK